MIVFMTVFMENKKGFETMTPNPFFLPINILN
jgi:hypothetical protein